jgi:hypothetical protein
MQDTHRVAVVERAVAELVPIKGGMSRLRNRTLSNPESAVYLLTSLNDPSDRVKEVRLLIWKEDTRLSLEITRTLTCTSSGQVAHARVRRNKNNEEFS